MTTQKMISNVPVIATSAHRKPSFASDVLKLVSGTVIAQILGVLAAPLLTRLYTPESFGMLALFNSITSILGVVVCLRYELTIVLPADDDEAANLFGASLIFSMVIALLSSFVVWWGQKQLLYWLNISELGPYLWLVPLTLFFGGLGVGHPALNYWATRTRRFKLISVTRIIGTVSTTCLQIGVGYTQFASGGSLIVANVVGAIITPLIMLWNIGRQDGRLFLSSINTSAMNSGIKRYREFPLLSTWAALLNTISWQLPTFLLSMFFSATTVGYYALGFRIIQAPMSLIGAALAQVFFSRAAEARIQGMLTALVDSMFVKLVMIGVFPFLTLAITGQDLFKVIFGVKWTEAGLFTQILGIWAFFWFISSPLSTLLSVLELQRFELQFNIMLLIARFTALSTGGIVQNARLAIFLFAVVGVVLYAYLCITLLNKSGLKLRRITNVFIQAALMYSPFGLCLIAVKYASVKPSYIVVTAIILALGYYTSLYKLQPNLFSK